MIQRIGIHSVALGSVEDINYQELLQGKRASILYTDPPWGDGNVRYWATMNKKMTGQDKKPLSYHEMIEILARIIRENVEYKRAWKTRQMIEAEKEYKNK